MCFSERYFTVSVISGCHNRTRQPGWLKYQHLYLTVLGPGRFQIKVPANLVTGEHVPGLQRTTFSYTFTRVFSSGMHLSLPLLIRLLIPSGGPNPVNYPKPRLQTPSHMNLGVHKYWAQYSYKCWWLKSSLTHRRKPRVASWTILICKDNDCKCFY